MPPEAVHAIYAGRAVALLTQHGKEQVLAPVLEPALGCRLQHVSGYDTDQLGTFSRAIPRAGSQLDAARRKARLGMELAGLPLGLASEGAFGADPVAGMLPWNVEILVWIDDSLGLEVVGRAQGAGCQAHLLASDWDAAEAFAQRIGFPAQQLLLRPDHQDGPRIDKDADTWTALAAQFDTLRAQSTSGQVFIETDGRAHANPTRRAMIAKAGEDLAARLAVCCPSCAAPGYGRIESLPGLPCSACQTPTLQAGADRFGCPRCAHQETRPRLDRAFADPRHCPYCNP